MKRANHAKEEKATSDTIAQPPQRLFRHPFHYIISGGVQEGPMQRLLNVSVIGESEGARTIYRFFLLPGVLFPRLIASRNTCVVAMEGRNAQHLRILIPSANVVFLAGHALRGAELTFLFRASGIDINQACDLSKKRQRNYGKDRSRNKRMATLLGITNAGFADRRDRKALSLKHHRTPLGEWPTASSTTSGYPIPTGPPPRTTRAFKGSLLGSMPDKH